MNVSSRGRLVRAVKQSRRFFIFLLVSRTPPSHVQRPDPECDSGEDTTNDKVDPPQI